MPLKRTGQFIYNVFSLIKYWILNCYEIIRLYR